MPRPRVFSFGGLFNGQSRSPDLTPTTANPSSPTLPNFSLSNGSRRALNLDTAASPARNSATPDLLDDAAVANSPSPNSALQQRQRTRADSGAGRPQSMIQTYAPAAMDVSGDTPPELAPIFGFLNSHSNKLYQEGYFLKLHDLDSRGRPSVERNWTECFAQLVGTVLSLWDAAALDAAGEEGEVLPTFINLSDASIKMIESLPMNSSAGGNLQNVLSISTAANNRYLLHFNSLNSLTQWTAGIRLAMYEHATLQEAYTGSLIAGKGKMLNNIKSVMERSRFKTEDWARVRFGAGTPWRRCWCVISPPAEKALQKMAKEQKKKNPYTKSQLPKGDIKFYDTRRINKKTRPIATISDAYAAYAIYPQSKPLIDQSTLVKVEGLITIHSSPETTTEGFLFVMPEVHAAVTGFEMLLRWLFPVWDTFNLYGRPNRLIADTLDSRGLMFAMPRDRRYGYLDILDVSGLIHTEGSQAWSERTWRAELKKLTSHRMNAGDSDPPAASLRGHSKSASRTSLPSMTSRAGVRFDGDQAVHSTPVSRRGSPAPPQDRAPHLSTPKRAGTAPVNGSFSSHRRSVSESMNYKRYQTETPSRLSVESGRDVREQGPPPPAHGQPIQRRPPPPGHLERINSEQRDPPVQSFEELNIDAARPPVTPVAQPPEFMHGPTSKPASTPYQAPELRRATSKMDAATLQQMQEGPYRDDGRDGYSQYRPNGPSSEVDIDATRFASAQADKSGRKDLVDRVLENNAHLSRTASNTSDPNLRRADSNTPPQHYQTSPRLDSLPSRKGLPSPSGSPARKPLPTLPSLHPDAPKSSAASSTSSVGGLGDQYIDADALETILQNDRSSTMKSSIPDYASVEERSVKGGPKNSDVDRPRAGRLKTVGDPSVSLAAEEERRRSRSAGRLDTFYQDQEKAKVDGLTDIDFGPTYSYKPGPRSSSRNALTPDVFVDARSSPSPSPAGAQRNSYFGGREAIASNAGTPMDNVNPSKRRSPHWQPGNNPLAGANAPDSLTPEQWVQHRASMASQSIGYRRPDASAERSSSNKRHSVAGVTPPRSRNPSGDWSRSLSRTPPLLSRPASRNAGAYLQSAGTPNPLDSSSKLTATEQMHVSRATGTPLVDMPRKDSRTHYDSNAGLYAALQAREQEKAAAKKGYQSSSVQSAIAAKQQQDMNARMAAQFQMQQRNALQAAQAAQAAHEQAQRQQQAAYAGALSMQQHNAQQQRQPSGGSMRSNARLSQHIDPFQLQGVPTGPTYQQRQPPSPYQPSQYQQSQYAQPQYPPSQYAQSQYAPSQYAPSQHPPSQYAQSQYPPSQYPQSNRASYYGGAGPATRPSPR